MNKIIDNYVSVLKKYAQFSGRASRAEYWYFFLANIIVSILLGIVGRMLGLKPGDGLESLSSLYSLVVLVPSLAVSVRRLHDTNRSGWWLFINIIPLIGQIVLLIFYITDSQSGKNQYGPNPKK